MALVDENNKDAMDFLDNLKVKFKLVLSLQPSYEQMVMSAVSYREHDTLKTSLLNIKLPKFNGYECSIDIYSFRSNFGKLYLKSTPSSLLPDLIKNNFLDNPALLLVKNVTDMEEIWRRLIETYGDHKTLLIKQNFSSPRIAARSLISNASQIPK